MTCRSHRRAYPAENGHPSHDCSPSLHRLFSEWLEQLFRGTWRVNTMPQHGAPRPTCRSHHREVRTMRAEERYLRSLIVRRALHAHTHVQRLSTTFGDMFTYRVGDVPISTIREPPAASRTRSFRLLQHNLVVGRHLLILDIYNVDGHGCGCLRDSSRSTKPRSSSH
jgi:hypothetical protein